MPHRSRDQRNTDTLRDMQRNAKEAGRAMNRAHAELSFAIVGPPEDPAHVEPRWLDDAEITTAGIARSR